MMGRLLLEPPAADPGLLGGPMIACDVLERLRSTPLHETYDTFMTNPVQTVQGRA
jgi:hypothetical protein